MTEETPPPTALKLQDDPERIDNPILSFFLIYWRSKRGQEALPSRADFTLRDYKTYLPWVALLDTASPYEEFRFRVIGGRVSRYFLENATGRTLTEAYGEEHASLEAAKWAFRRVCKNRSPLRMTGPAATWQGHYFPNWDALYLPLGNDRRATSHLFVVFTFNYEEFKRTRDPREYLLSHA